MIQRAMFQTRSLAAAGFAALLWVGLGCGNKEETPRGGADAGIGRPNDLMKARAGFQTRVSPNPNFKTDGPAQPPPRGIYQLIRYPSPAGKLAAYLSPDPGDGKKHPAIVWAKGGFGGIGSFLWGVGSNQHPEAFRKAGFIVMCPSWRGENDNPGQFELFYGEVDDAVAAVEYVARLPYVDSSRIYMAGHSTGGTITLLAAEATDKLRAAFPLGGAPDIERVLAGPGYGNTPFDNRDQKELQLRSPILYVETLRCPTFYFEGTHDPDGRRDQFGYLPDAARMEEKARKANVSLRVYPVEGGTHFTIIGPVTNLLAKKLLADTGPRCNITITADEVNQAFARRGVQ
jgi:pimeloyl-ACP methyl ester carboxylesterase